MAENWTPGPWKNGDGLVNGRMPDGRVSFDIFDAAECPGDEDEAHANAHLIAAAPEMYDAGKAADPIIEEVVAFLCEISERPGDRADVLAARLEGAGDRNRAALRKARGED